MYILGVNPGWHDSSAALLKDGKLVVLVEQDRVSRKKNAMGERPTEAMLACLRSLNGVRNRYDDAGADVWGWDRSGPGVRRDHPQPGESQRRPATNASSQLIMYIGLPVLSKDRRTHCETCVAIRVRRLLRAAVAASTGCSPSSTPSPTA